MKAANAIVAGQQRDLSRIGLIDYMLMTFGSCLAGYAGGMAINEPRISWFVVQWILIGAAIIPFLDNVLPSESILMQAGR